MFCRAIRGFAAALKVTIQMVSFAGPGMVEGYLSGNESALEGLSCHLSNFSSRSSSSPLSKTTI
jgi:hypothetical protein